MIVKLNGQYLTTIGEQNSIPDDEMIVVKKGFNKNLRKMATTLWTLSGTMMMKSQALAASGNMTGTNFWVEMKPLIYFFQDISMVLGVLAIIAGIILLVVKKRWGVATLKITSFAVIGVFLVPSAVLLLAILGMFLDDSLTTVLENIRAAREIAPVNGGR